MEFFNTANSSLPDRALALGLAAAGAALAASVFYTPIPLALAIVIPASVFFMTRPYELLLVMVFLIPFNFVIPVGGVPVAAELLKIVLWIPFLIHGDVQRIGFRRSRYDKWLAIWSLILVASILRANNLPFAIKEVVRFGSNIGFCYLTINLVNTREKLFQALRVLIFSAFLVACYGFYQFAIQDYGALFWIVNPRLDTDLSPGRYTFWEWRDRITSVLTSEMELGHYFNLCLPIGVALWVEEGHRHIRSKWLWMTVAMLIGLLLTLTFGAWLALAAASVAFLPTWTKKQGWKTLIIGFLVGVLVVSSLVFGPLRPLVEAKILATGASGLLWDVVTRLDIWSFALHTWLAHPLFGVGVGSYELLDLAHETVMSAWAPSGSSPHQTYLYLLVDSGVIGLFSMLMILLGTIRSNLRIRMNRKVGVVAWALGFALIVNMLGWFSDDSTFFGPHTSYLVWFFIGLSEVVRNLSDEAGLPGVSVAS